MKVKEPITEYSKLDLEGTYTYLDYLRFQFKERVELLKGRIIKMSPAPNNNHQWVLNNLIETLHALFRRQPCRVCIAPFDVRLFPLKSGRDRTVVQPDICIICDESKFDGQGCAGAPDLVIEILSPGNSKNEMSIKYELYQEAGVKEYWIIEPSNRVVLVYVLKGGKFIGLRPFVENMTVESVLFPKFRIKIEDVFYRVKQG